MVMGSMLFVKCKKIQDPTDNLKLFINYNVIKTTVSVSFVDAATDSLIRFDYNFKDVTVNLGGKDADKILDVTGATKSSFTSANGFLAFGVDPSYTPTSGNPIEFTIIAECQGYASTSIPVKLYDESHRSIIINMVDLNNLPTGVVRKTDNSGHISSDIVDNDVVLETSPAGTTGTKAKLTIKQGTKIKDAEGNVLSGDLSAELIYYNNMDQRSLASFPGGLTPSINESGNQGDAMFYSAGFARIEITDENGKKAKTFENEELELTVEIANNTYNKNTGTQIADGDQVPVWSYDLESGIWNFEKDAAIVNVGGTLQATTGISHLTFFNLDWWDLYNVPPPLIGAYIVFRLMFGKDATADPILIPLEITIKKKADGTFINKYLIQAPIDEEYPIGAWGLGNTPVILEIRNMCDVTNVQTEEIIDPSQGVYEIDLENVTPTGQTVNVYFEGWCPNNPDIIIRPTMPFVYREICSGEQWIWTYMHEGYATLYNLNLNSAYSVGVYYDGEFYQEGVILEDPNQNYSIEFTPEVCDIIGQ